MSKKPNKTELVQVRMTRALVAEIRRSAPEGENLSSTIRIAIREYLRRCRRTGIGAQ